MSLSLTPPTLQRPAQQIYTPSFTFSTIFPITVAELLDKVKSRERSLYTLPSKDNYIDNYIVYILDTTFTLYIFDINVGPQKVIAST